MKKANERVLNSGIYARIREVRMSGADREYALKHVRAAESLVDTILWVKEKAAGLGNYFLKPSMKH